jgi:glutathione peroxidase
MMRSVALAGITAVVLMITVVSVAQDKPQEKPVPDTLNFRMKSLTGQDVNLADYSGKVILMVNTASKCGYTPQYEGLQALYTKYKDKGLVLLGFPSNDFGGQEPGTDSQIAEFCKANYGVTFPMFSKVAVKGDQKVALYKYLTEHAPTTGEIKWNFEKFLIGKEGKIVNRFLSKIEPTSDEITKAVEAELAK